jgi:hypothetical protein
MVNTTYEDNISNKLFQEIVDALNKKDQQALRNLFSPNALKEADDIDGGIEYLMDLYQGTIISKEGGFDEGSGGNDHGAKTYDVASKYDVTTEVDKYVLFFVDRVIDTENPENIGLTTLEIIKGINEEWYETMAPGIYRPPKTTE